MFIEVKMPKQQHNNVPAFQVTPAINMGDDTPIRYIVHREAHYIAYYTCLSSEAKQLLLPRSKED